VDVVASGQWFSIGGPDLYFSQFDTPDNNGGVARRMDWERGVGAACVVSAREWTLQGMLSNRTKGVPTAAFGTRFNDGRSSTEDTRWAVDVGYRRDLGTTARLTGRLSVDGYQYEGSYPYELLQTDASTGLWNGAEVHVQWDTHPFNRLDAGVTYTWNRRSDYRLWNSETSLFSRNAPFDFGSVYLQNSTQVLSNVSLALAARADHHSQVGWIFTPRLAAVYNPWAGGTLKALYGEAFRAPTTYELYYEEPGVQRASPGLKHERSRTWEISVEQRLSPILMLYSSYFDISMHDLIDQAVDPVDSLTQYVNLSEVRSTGVEIELLARWRTGVTISASGSLQSARDGSTDRRLNNSPTTVLKMHGGTDRALRVLPSHRLRYAVGSLCCRRCVPEDEPHLWAVRCVASRQECI
jgi:iron complex outermembrane receptor protein